MHPKQALIRWFSPSGTRQALRKTLPDSWEWGWGIKQDILDYLSLYFRWKCPGWKGRRPPYFLVWASRPNAWRPTVSALNSSIYLLLEYRRADVTSWQHRDCLRKRKLSKVWILARPPKQEGWTGLTTFESKLTFRATHSCFPSCLHRLRWALKTPGKHSEWRPPQRSPVAGLNPWKILCFPRAAAACDEARDPGFKVQGSVRRDLTDLGRKKKVNRAKWE